MGMVVSRFDVWLIELDPTKGSEINKTRPCLVVSPDELNRPIRTIIIAPMTTKGKIYKSRIPCVFDNKDGFIVVDQIKAVDKERLVSKLGTIDKKTGLKVLSVLQELFTE